MRACQDNEYEAIAKQGDASGNVAEVDVIFYFEGMVKNMARIEKEIPVKKVRYIFEGNDDDVLAFMKAAAFEYLLSNLAQAEAEDDMHNKCA